MKKIVGVALIAVLGVTALTGCIPEKGSTEALQDDRLHENSLTLSDGREVICIVRGDNGSYRGGISCDWDNAK